ncbi:NADPH-dependent assimilatory sulfite reductase hemoprotein subunit [Ectothiorhodospira lacustris]|uniref:NADPH-dependent assimilatory sulfite reductase hemoprotein subunit n=1 Tax=Ectothiorhodospira lacustris TaxID=2899127 RepID=UPI001EE7C406|nr:NADPH-dependent assimilatory sulfite reductase hemoprotein subunit [Ectothiorhodospira lacustris]MCG5509764.1 NADPH-dependent assimilatory sulfite reductase hemoprotein subunit [Ectothiorhodospira lacustris]MCG5522322.1 NADPH-dependent assimilatory sulfite reductase hemoprotein subunit [Ectothiorhodospira lacustris]
MSGLDVEKIKRDSRRLRGSVAEGLEDPVTGALAEADTVITKFHGIYQQDDRDTRNERREARLEPAYQFMIRVRVPGGVINPKQWQALDELAGSVANGTLRLTTRQAVQFHGVAKEDLRTLMRGIDAVLMDSLAACGDVNRNVMCHVQPEASEVHAQALQWAQRLSAHLTPKTGAWREIWIDGKKVADSETEPEAEPLYGETYLPRKFKIGVAIPPINDVDIFSQDLGFIAIEEEGRLVGFNVTVGGGLGCTHGEPKTFPRLGDVIGFIPPGQLLELAETVVTIQRDFGDRKERKHARFKYTIEDRGLDWLRQELQGRLQATLEPARAFEFIHSGDRYGWTEAVDGSWQLNLFILSGRLFPQQRQGLRVLIDEGVVADVRLTPNQNLVLAGVSASHRARVEETLAAHGLDEHRQASPVRLNAMACVALPTCGLAMAEAERYLPDLVRRIEEMAARHGVEEQPITVRISGCPNGCSRPYLAEIGLVGRAPGRYNLYLGAGFDGSRLNRLALDNANEADILEYLDGAFAHFAAGREPGEHFGNFLVRAGFIAPAHHGRDVNL